MQVGEYISVSSQRDAEKADIEKERQEQLKGPAAQASGPAPPRALPMPAHGGTSDFWLLPPARGGCQAARRGSSRGLPAAAWGTPCAAVLPSLFMQARELEELAQIYVERGLPYDLARQVGRAALGTQGTAGGMRRVRVGCRWCRAPLACMRRPALRCRCWLLHPLRCRSPLQVAVVLTEKDVIRAHARDELGIGKRGRPPGRGGGVARLQQQGQLHSGACCNARRAGRASAPPPPASTPAAPQGNDPPAAPLTFTFWI